MMTVVRIMGQGTQVTSRKEHDSRVPSVPCDAGQASESPELWLLLCQRDLPSTCVDELSRVSDSAGCQGQDSAGL